MTVAVTPAAQGMAYAGYLMRLRTDAELLNPDYLTLALASPQMRAQIELPARSTSGVHNINTQEVRGLGVHLPPIDEQREIVRRAQKMLQAAERLSVQIDLVGATVARVSPASLAKAFRGELVPTEAALADQAGRDFESAAELLARVESPNSATPHRRRKIAD